MSIEIPSQAVSLYPETLDGQRVALGETKMGAIDYIKNFGGIVINVMGHSEELEKRFPEPEKDQSTGLLVTQNHTELARITTDAASYFKERAEQSAYDGISSRVGLRANFADFTHRTLPSALYFAVIQPGHRTATLSKQALQRDIQGKIIGKAAPLKIENPDDFIQDLLSKLAKYHLEAITAESLRQFGEDQKRRNEDALRQRHTEEVPRQSWLQRLRHPR